MVIPARSNESKRLSVTGTIVGVDIFSMFGFPTHDPFDSPLRRAVFILRVDKVKGGRESSKYIYLHYKYWYYDSIKLSDDVRDGKQTQTFVVEREKQCDGKLRDLIPLQTVDENGTKLGQLERLVHTEGGKNENLPLETSLPCYSTDPGNLRPPQ